MVHLKKLSLRNFKSFRSADITLTPGLVCLAGPNGSGKSNVADAVRFALGELSLKQLRPEGKKASGLIRRGAGQAHVGVEFGGDGGLEVRRAIRKDGKMAYRLDGKRATRASVIDELRKMGADVGEHNIIAQGEVDRVVKMNARERREIIDKVSGVYEFEEKKREALSELAKVEGRIGEANIAIAEREGVIAELEKQRDEALRHSDLTTELRRAKGTLIHSEMTRLEAQFEKSARRGAELQASHERLQHDLEALEAKVAGLEAERAKVAGMINERAGREGLRDELERLRTAIESNSKLAQEKGRQADGVRKRLGELKEELEAERAKVKVAGEEVLKAEKESKGLGAEIRKGEKERARVLSGAGGKRAAELRKRHSELLRQMEERKEEALEAGAAVSRDSEIARLKEEELARLREEVGGGSGKAQELEAGLKEMRGRLAELERGEEELFGRERELNRKLPEFDRKILELGNRLPELRMAGGRRPAVDSVLGAAKKGELEGIVGTVMDSCTFDEKYALAVEASAGPRLQYVLAEDVDAATDAIEHLKKTKAGRCTFIPLDRKMSELPPEAVRFEKAKGVMGFLINLVQFDKKHHSAMHYVFGDTVLVQDTATAKRLAGRVRAVTLEGELFERSGVITGGTFGSASSLKSRVLLERLERQMEDVQKAKKGSLEELYSLRELLGSKRKEKGALEVKARGVEIELESLRAQQEKRKGVEKKVSELEEEAGRLRASIAESGKRAGSLKESLARVESELSSVSKMLDSQELPEEKAEELALIEAKIGELTERRRGLDNTVSSKKTEAALLEESMGKGREELGEAEGSLKETLSTIAQLEESMESDSGLLAEKEAKLREVSKKMAKLYEQQQKMGAEIETASREKGKAQFEFNRVAGELGEMKSAREMAETRLGDLKAEWAEYEGTEPLKMSKRELEDRIRQIEGELTVLGAVNMLAPEQYEQKSRELGEKKEMIRRLEAEKKAVLNMIEEIEGRKAEIFLETFRAIDENFRKIFNYAFPGEGMLVLDNPDEIFNSGLQIKFTVKGKEHYLDAKSGGERSLLALLFVFAIHSTKPSSFYILDEADSALDKENSKKLADMLKELSRKAQFIVVTHNDTMLSAADIALGVTKQEGVSKVVGIEFKKIRAS